MTFLKKATVACAAMSMVAAPVAASAAPAASFDGLRASSDLENAAGITGSTWLLGLIGLAAVIGGIVIAADGSSSAPTSP